MNGIEKITARIETDAKGEIAEILREGEAKAAQIRASSQTQADLAAKAAAAAGKEEIIHSAKDNKRVGAQVVEKANALVKGGKLTLSGETREMDGGLILKDGQVEVNCAFETQLRVLREEMTAEVASILFT